MSILSWNCRGLGNPGTIHVLMDLIHSKKPAIVFLMETLVNMNKLESIKIKLGFKGLFAVDNRGHSGGLAFMWTEGTEVDITSYSRNYVDSIVRLEGGSLSWRFTGFYGFPERNKRKESWQLLKHLSTVNSLPWVVMGDFNDILHEKEKRGRLPHPSWLIRGFKETVETCGLRDFPFDGHQFTWEKSRGTPNWVEEKLDRILVSDGWLDVFGEAKATSLEASQSDHIPIILWPVPSIFTRPGKKFKFENLWLREEQCREVVLFSWRNSIGLNILDRINHCGEAVGKWGNDYARKFQSRIKDSKLRMGLFRNRHDPHGLRGFIEAQKEYLYLLEQQNSYWKQRAKEFWLQGGDTNSRFFHNSVNHRRRNNRIVKLRGPEGDWVTDKSELGNMMVSYFQKLFTSTPGIMTNVLDCVEKSITDDQNAMLNQRVNREEVRAALFDMLPDKSPGCDGMNPGFFSILLGYFGD